jgi:hypothetical protein
MQATPEEMASWPAPNFDNPQSCSPVLIGLTAPTMALVFVFTGVRFYGKGILRNALGLDDWIMLVAAVRYIATSHSLYPLTLLLDCINTSVDHSTRVSQLRSRIAHVGPKS